jgi:hypothetical protein
LKINKMTEAVKGYTVEATKKLILQGEDMILTNPIDGQVLKRVGGVWVNGTGGEGTAAVESLVWNALNGELGWVVSGSVANSLLLDGRYPVIGGGGYYTQSEVDTLVANAQSNVFSISLPYATTVHDRIAGATEGVDYPTGWILTDDGLNIVINHGTGRRLANATVFMNPSGTIEQLLTGTSAFNGLFSLDVNTVRLNSLSKATFPIIIYLTLE